MHNIQELKRQLGLADSALNEARNRQRAARQNYEAAICAEKMAEFSAQGGTVGVTRVRVGDWAKGSNTACMKRGPFLVTGAKMRFYRPVFILAKIKKDGKASSAACAEYPVKVFIVPEDQP